jgi:site-specific recombinase XerD
MYAAAIAFDAYCKRRWAMTGGERGLKPETISRTLKAVEDLQTFSNKHLWELDANCVDSWQRHLLCDRRLAIATVESNVAAVRRVTDFLRNAPDLQRQLHTDLKSHFQGIANVERMTRSCVPLRREPLQQEQVGQLFSHLDERIRCARLAAPREAARISRDRLMLAMTHEFALRPSECVALDVQSWERTCATSKVASKDEITVPVHARGRRGAGPMRRLAVNATVGTLLEGYISEDWPTFNVKAERHGAPLFAATDGARISVRSFLARTRNHFREAGLDPKQYRLKDLRHASLVHKSSCMPLTQLEEWLGIGPCSPLT